MQRSDVLQRQPRRYLALAGRCRLGLLCLATVAISDGCTTDSGLKQVREVDGPFVHVGTMRHGKKHGQWQTYTDGKVTFVEHWRDGVKHGPFRGRQDEVMSDGVYRNGMMHGRYREFWNTETRTLAILGFLSRNRRERTWCEWDMDGRLTRIAVYQQDRLMREELDPPGACPVTHSDRYHLDPDDRTYD